MTLADLKAVIQSDTNLRPEAVLQLFFNNNPLSDNTKTIAEMGIGEGENLLMAVRDPSAPTRQPQARAQAAQRRGLNEGGNEPIRPRRGPDPETLRLNMIGDPRVRAAVRQQNPELADAADDPQRFRDTMSRMHRMEDEEQARRQEEIEMLHADPLNEENQKKIAEIIRQEAVMENLQNAMEHTPEGELFQSPPP
jgi:DNA damage-inducible protein 1